MLKTSFNHFRIFAIIFIIPFFVFGMSGNFYDVNAATFVPPPLKQIKEGIDPVSVTCSEGLELVLKKSTGKSACLKPESVAKLIDRGWAIHVLPNYTTDNNNSEIFPLGEHEIETKLVSYYGDTKGFLAKPVTPGKFPSVIMIHEWWGLNDNIKEMAKKLASQGYIVLAVDLYNNHVGTTAEEARQLVTQFDGNEGLENMNSAIKYLKTQQSAEKVGSIGWCFGGGQSLNLAVNSKLDATVIYYGQVVSDSEKLSNISWPLLGIFAEKDSGIPVESVKSFESKLDDLGITNEIIIYPGVDHAFANPSGERYAPEESKDAWKKTLEFFNQNLK